MKVEIFNIEKESHALKSRIYLTEIIKNNTSLGLKEIVDTLKECLIKEHVSDIYYQFAKNCIFDVSDPEIFIEILKHNFVYARIYRKHKIDIILKSINDTGSNI